MQLSEILKSIEFDRKEMNKNIDSFVNDPLESHLKSDLIYLKVSYIDADIIAYLKILSCFYCYLGT